MRAGAVDGEAGGDAGEAIMARLADLATCSSEPGELTRLFLTPAHRDAVALVRTWMTQAGMEATLDAAGTVVGRYPAARDGAPTLIVGSHIDTVRNAGRYDGALGVVVAIHAVATLARRGERLPFNIDVVAFGDEEGVRFPVTLTGSRALGGSVKRSTLDCVDQAGVRMADALRAFGCDPARIGDLARKPADTLGYLEVHIEQGPVLEAEGLRVGVVTAISGATRMRIDVEGVAGHAGTVPMALRRDALMAAAEMGLAAERLALDSGDLVATVGRLDLKPGAVNVIPSQVTFTLDIRSAADPRREAAVARLREDFAAIALRRGVACTAEVTYEQPSAACDPTLIGTLSGAVAEAALPVRLLPSGAGHDGLALASLCPIGMLFVRCQGGISHNPAESIIAEDAAVAADVLVRAVRRLAGQTG